MRRLLLLSAAFLILVAIAVPTAIVYYVVFTESGLKFIVRHVPHEIGGVHLDIVNAGGTIAHGIHAERVEIDHHLVHLRFEGIQGHVALAPLLWQTIRSPDAYVRSAYIRVKRRTKPPTPSEPVFLPRWLIISAEQTRVGTAVLVVPNGNRLEATELVGAAVLRHRTIRFFEAQGQMGDTHIAAIGELHAADPLQLDVDGRINWSPDGQPAWTVVGTAKGDLDALIVNAHTTLPFRCDFSGRALDLTSHWHWLGNAVVHDFDLRSWGVSGPLGIITGRLALNGDSEGFSARGPVNPTGLHAGLFEAEFTGAYANHVLTAKNMDVRHIGSGAHATGAGTIGIVKNGPRLDLHGSWRDFRWPLVGADVPVRSASGEFTLDGILPYTVHASGVATVRDLPPMPMQVEGTLGKDRFTYSRAEVVLLDGHASLNGAVTWAPVQSWSVAGYATGIDPSGFRTDLPGKLNFTLAAEGQSFDPKGEMTAEFHDLGGRLRGVPASGGGKLSHSGSAWQFDSIRVELGRTRLALDGRIDAAVDLRFAVTADDLSLLAADSHGRLQAAGTIRGTLEDPTIAATAHGSGIHHNGIVLDGFHADIDFDPRPQHDSKVDARLRNLTYDNRTLEDVTFTLGGKPASYAMRLDIRTIGLAVTAQAAGPFEHGVFRSQLSALTINGDKTLHLELERPVGLLLSAQQARLEWLCLIGSPASMCADGDWSPA